MRRSLWIAAALLWPAAALGDGVYLDRNFTNTPSHSRSGKRTHSQVINPGTVHAGTPKAKSVHAADPTGSSSHHSRSSSW